MSPEHERTHLTQILELFVEESWRSIYRGELEVRPPGAPTIQPGNGVASRPQCLTPMNAWTTLKPSV